MGSYLWKAHHIPRPKNGNFDNPGSLARVYIEFQHDFRRCCDMWIRLVALLDYRGQCLGNSHNEKAQHGLEAASIGLLNYICQIIKCIILLINGIINQANNGVNHLIDGMNLLLIVLIGLIALISY